MNESQRAAAERLADDLQRFDGAERESLRDEAAALLRELLAEPQGEPVATLLEQSRQNCLRNFGPNGLADWIYNDLLARSAVARVIAGRCRPRVWASRGRTASAKSAEDQRQGADELMTPTLPPLPPRDLGTIRLGRVDQDMGYSDEAMRAYAEQAVAAERERCAAICDQRSADHWRAYGDKTSPHFCDARFEAFSDEAEECAKEIRDLA